MSREVPRELRHPRIAGILHQRVLAEVYVEQRMGEQLVVNGQQRRRLAEILGARVEVREGDLSASCTCSQQSAQHLDPPLGTRL